MIEQYLFKKFIPYETIFYVVEPTVSISPGAIETETKRLLGRLEHLGWSYKDCEAIAETTLAINRVKNQKNAVILAHSYQTPDIIFGVADFVGDSLGLSKQAAKTDADIIVFAGVVFMAETAKILSPDKVVLAPRRDADCSLAASITGDDVIDLKLRYPGQPVVTYVNTTADVKAESDICVTSANVLDVVEDLPDGEIIFLPDKNMGAYLAKETDKRVIGWEGSCIVHEEFDPRTIIELRKAHPNMVIIAHSECPGEVLQHVDVVGGTSDMQRYIEAHPEQKEYFLVTECGLSTRFQVEYPDRQFYGTCLLCPYMKKVQLDDILNCLTEPSKDQIIEVPDMIQIKARKTLDYMIED